MKKNLTTENLKITEFNRSTGCST